MHILSFIQSLVIVLSLSFLVSDGSAQVVVIANLSVPVDSITNAELYDLYAFEKRRWEDGQPVIVFDLEQDRDIRSGFFNFLGKSPSRMKSIWLIHKLSGEGEPPEALPNKEDMITRVADTPGAIGFARIPVQNDSVKILATID